MTVPRFTAADFQPVALVTGAGRRVGNCIAHSLAQAGYRVAVHYLSSAEQAQATVAEIEAAGGTALAMKADLQDSITITHLIEQIVARWGRIDVLTNSAAIWESKPLEEVTADDVRRHFEINALGTFLCAQQVGLQMVNQATGGAIVNIGDWAVTRPYLDYAAYFPSKGAVVALTRSLAVELGTRNPAVRVNAILPGPVLLPAEMSAGERQAVIDQTLVRREGSPEHVAHAVKFLLENDFVTGVCLPVDGGRTIFAP
jgi:pteridine reductase